MRPQRRQPARLPHPWDSPGKNTGVGCHFLLQFMKVKCESEVAQSCPTLSDPMECSPPGSSIHRIFQARVLEWGATALYFSTCCYSLPSVDQPCPDGSLSFPLKLWSLRSRKNPWLLVGYTLWRTSPSMTASLINPFLNSSSSIPLADEIRQAFHSVWAVDSRTADVVVTLSQELALSLMHYGVLSIVDLSQI